MTSYHVYKDEYENIFIRIITSKNGVLNLWKRSNETEWVFCRFNMMSLTPIHDESAEKYCEEVKNFITYEVNKILNEEIIKDIIE